MRSLVFICLAVLFIWKTQGNALARSNRILAPIKPALRVLVIGNSYSAYNNLPTLIDEIASASEGFRSIHVRGVTSSGATLEEHWKRGHAVQIIEGRRWDFVVLQEQSMRPLEDISRMRLYANKFNRVIKRNGATTVLFVTWARRGDQAMQQKLNNAYLNIAGELGAVQAPVGPAWQKALIMDPSIGLYAADGSHPSLMGSYLAACTLFQLFAPESDGKCRLRPEHAIGEQQTKVVERAVLAALGGDPCHDIGDKGCEAR